MKWIARLGWVAWILLAAAMAFGQADNPPSKPRPSPAPGGSTIQAQTNTAAYTLTPERRAQAIEYSHTLYFLDFLGTLVAIGIYWLLWRTGIAVMFRNWARRVSPRLFLQCLIFVPLLAAAATLLNLPLDYYGSYVVEHRFGLSTMSVAAWLGDWAKNLAVAAAGGVIAAWVLYTVIRRSPRRWWFYFWLASIPMVLGLILIEPYVIEPLYYRFTPLDQTHPALVTRIEAMMKHAGLSVPPSHIFESNASSRTTAIDAYVSGLGSSKRVVVWDTTLKRMTPDELLLVLGHETGHYVLHHIPKEFALDEAIALIYFFAGFLAATWLVKRVGPGSGMGGVDDLASLPLLMMVLTVMVFFSDPPVNAVSRHYEHQADQFGLEVAYGIVPNPNAAEIHALEILGVDDLADPDPPAFIKFWLYTHPPLDERIRFASTYKPWAEGKPMKLLPQAH